MSSPQAITFRTAAPADLAAIAGIDAGWSDTRRLRIEQALLELRVHVAVDAERALAFGIINHDWFGHPFIELLIVHPQHRRRGVGRALLRHLISAAARERVFTSTNESNEAMRRLLEGEGFGGSGVIENLDEGDAELVFVWFAPPR